MTPHALNDTWKLAVEELSKGLSSFVCGPHSAHMVANCIVRN